MNTERRDEMDVKEVVERFLGVQLEHADKDGGVDGDRLPRDARE